MNTDSITTGTRVRLRRDVERFPHFIASAGLTGTVTVVEPRQICVRMDVVVKGAEQWDNEVVWYDEGPGTGMGREEFMDDVEVLDRVVQGPPAHAEIDATVDAIGTASEIGHNIFQFIPMLDADADRVTARHWLTTVTRNIGIGFHPDTPGKDYVVEGRRSMSDEDAARYDAGLDRCHDVLDDLYEFPMLVLRRIGADLFPCLYDTLNAEKATLDNVELVERGDETCGAVEFSTDAWDGVVEDYDYDRCEVRVSLIWVDGEGDRGPEMASLRCHPTEVLNAIQALDELLRRFV